jgi:sigma-E factor negative regulatory protein RseC
MTAPEWEGFEPGAGPLVEQVARVVSRDGDTVWLEPETTASCSGCLSLAACGGKGGSGRALAARRFPLPGDLGLRVGDRVVVGLPDGAVLRASATAYAVPLVTMIGAGILAGGLGAGDGAGAAAILGGLVLGLLIAGVLARRLSNRGDLSPRFLRRAVVGSGAGGLWKPE